MNKFLLITLFSGFLILTGMQLDDLSKSIQRGKNVYADFCITCHMPNGEGSLNVYPPLAKSDFLMNRKEESIRAVKYGLTGKIKVNGLDYNGTMLALGLEDEEIADVMNYILNNWGNKNQKMITVLDVKSVKK